MRHAEQIIERKKGITKKLLNNPLFSLTLKFEIESKFTTQQPNTHRHTIYKGSTLQERSFSRAKQKTHREGKVCEHNYNNQTINYFKK